MRGAPRESGPDGCAAAWRGRVPTALARASGARGRARTPRSSTAGTSGSRTPGASARTGTARARARAAASGELGAARWLRTRPYPIGLNASERGRRAHLREDVGFVGGRGRDARYPEVPLQEHLRRRDGEDEVQFVEDASLHPQDLARRRRWARGRRGSRRELRARGSERGRARAWGERRAHLLARVGVVRDVHELVHRRRVDLLVLPARAWGTRTAARGMGRVSTDARRARSLVRGRAPRAKRGGGAYDAISMHVTPTSCSLLRLTGTHCKKRSM